MTDDPGMKDMLSFLIARDTMHQQQWLAAIEDAGDTFNNAPNDVLDEGDYKQYAYSFFGHAEEPMSATARWLSGPSIDGRGEFTYADPAPRLGQEPQLMQGPASAHGGIEATRAESENGDGIVQKMKETVAEKLT
jgi:Mn-containing catalase